MLRTEDNKLIKYLAICATLAVCTIRFASVVGQWAMGFSVLLGIILWHNNKENFSLSKEVKGYIKAYGIFVLLTVPSLFFSDNPFESIQSFLHVWIWRYVIFVIIAGFIKRRDYLVNMLAVFLAVSSVECLFTVVEILKNIRPDGRGWGFTPLVLTLAGIMCMLLPVVLVILMDPGFEKKLKKVSAFAVVSILAGLFCNKSRGAWLTELIVVPIATFRYLKQNKHYLAVVLVVFLGIAGFIASDPQYAHRMQTITNITTVRSNVDRIRVWKSARKMFRDHPVTGVGVGRFRVMYLEQYRYRRERQKLGHAHNNFIQVGAESGVIGLAGFLYFVGYCLYNSLRNYRNHKNPYDILVFTTFFGYVCVFGQIDYTMGFSTGIRIMWFLLAVLLQLKETERPPGVIQSLPGVSAADYSD